MTTFTIQDDFMLDGQPVKLISGALHYFRIVPEYWQDRLEKLKNMGCNCVETYIPWNYHEPKKGSIKYGKDKSTTSRRRAYIGHDHQGYAGWERVRYHPKMCIRDSNNHRR